MAKKSLIKLKESDAVLVLHADGTVNVIIPDADMNPENPDQAMSDQSMHMAAIAQLFTDEEFSERMWGLLFDRLREQATETSPIIS